MNPDSLAHWKAADAAFDQWLDLPENERDTWLATQAFPEPVRKRFEQLVTAHRQPRASLDPGNGLAGQRLGDWTLESELGRGGMAVVHRAWRDAGMARQEAAVKILTLGALGAAGRERFRREAVILARLNHPNITTLVDSGVTDDGTCWLAMPLVEGERIDRWCESHATDAKAIVYLALQVCEAVAYAHRNLVIHRDLKPSNVLVDAGGHVHLLDFGIGQFTDADDERTQTMWRALTPGYAAPEQLAGAAPSTAVDIYGLGALLRRLLSGHAKSDLDRVLLKALAEDPEQRYATAEALADDLRRWRAGEPVLAQKPRLGYRIRKFVTRNKAGVAAGVLLAATLAGGIGATLWQAAEARRSAEHALTQERRATAARDFMAQLFEASDPDTAMGRTLSARELLDQGAHRLRGAFAETPALRAEMLVLVGNLYRRIGEVDAARPLLDEALQLAGTVDDPGVVMDARFAMGLLDLRANRRKEALAAFEAVERMFETAGKVPGDEHGQLVMHRAQALRDLLRLPDAVSYAEASLARARGDAALPRESLFFYLVALSKAVIQDGQEQRAESLLNEALALRSVDKLPPTARLPLHSELSDLALARGDLALALRESETALDLAGQVYLPSNPARAVLLDNRGGILTHMARLDDAVTAFEESISIYQAVDPEDKRGWVSPTYNNIALALDNAERDAEAEPYLVRARAATEASYGRNHQGYAIVTANLGNLYRQTGRLDEADTLLAESLQLRRELLGDDHPYVGHGLVQMARLRLRQGRAADALALAQQAAGIYAKAEYKDPRRLASTDEVRAVAMAALGRVDEAVALFDQAIDDARQADIDNGVEWPRVMAARAELFARHVPGRAPAALDDALAAHRLIYGEAHPGTQRMLALAATLSVHAP